MFSLIFGHPTSILIGFGDGRYIGIGHPSTTSGPPHRPLANSYEPYWIREAREHNAEQARQRGPGPPRVPQ